MSPRTRIVSLAALACTAIAGSVALTPAAEAASAWPAAPVGVHVSRIDPTAFAVAASRVSNVTQYRLLASPVEADLYGNGLMHPSKARVAATSTSPNVAVTGLKYTTGLIYYRYQSLHGANARMTDIRSVSLRPTTPTSAAAVATGVSTYLTWNSVPATSFTIVQATNPALTANRRVYTVRGQNTSFTPTGTSRGRAYYFVVRAVNGTTPSPYTSVLEATNLTGQQNVRFMTYNILTSTTDGQVTSGEKIAPWASQRRAAVAALVKKGNPDVIAVQEGSAWNSSHQRQVDTLRSALGSTYTVAHTEDTWPSTTTFRADDYIVYRNTTWAPYGTGGHFYTANGLYAAYQGLQSKVTGARFLAVSVHLSKGNDNDAVRRVQTDAITKNAAAIASRYGNLPVVYAGDYSSVLASWHPYDAPGVAMRNVRATDASYVAPSRSNTAYNTANSYLRVAPHKSVLIDRVFGSPGIAFTSWTQLLNLSGGRFTGVIPSDHNPVLVTMSIPVPA